MNDLIKLITESEETTEFSDFYALTGTWMDQLVDFLLWNGFELIRKNYYFDYRFGEYSEEVYQLIKNNVLWDGRDATEEYIFEFSIPKKAMFPAFLFFTMYIRHANSRKEPNKILYCFKRIDNKNLLAITTELMRQNVEKTIAITDTIRPTGNSKKLKEDLIKHIV